MTESHARRLLLDATCDEPALLRLAATLARAARVGDLYALDGPLGAGKSTFARAFVRALVGPDEPVPSPTFTLVQSYQAGRLTIQHYDLYRLSGLDEAWELGIEEAFADGVCLIEWPDRLGEALPARALVVALAPTADDSRRRVRLSGDVSWPPRLAALTGGDLQDGGRKDD